MSSPFQYPLLPDNSELIPSLLHMQTFSQASKNHLELYLTFLSFCHQSYTSCDEDFSSSVLLSSWSLFALRFCRVHSGAARVTQWFSKMLLLIIVPSKLEPVFKSSFNWNSLKKMILRQKFSIEIEKHAKIFLYGQLPIIFYHHKMLETPLHRVANLLDKYFSCAFLSFFFPLFVFPVSLSLCFVKWPNSSSGSGTKMILLDWR